MLNTPLQFTSKIDGPEWTNGSALPRISACTPALATTRSKGCFVSAAMTRVRMAARSVTSP